MALIFTSPLVREVAPKERVRGIKLYSLGPSTAELPHEDFLNHCILIKINLKVCMILSNYIFIVDNANNGGLV